MPVVMPIAEPMPEAPRARCGADGVRDDVLEDVDEAQDAGEDRQVAQRCAVAARPRAARSGGSNAGARGLSQARAK